MNIENEKLERLSCYLSEDAERAEKLLQMSSKEALGQINSDTGLVFTDDELHEMGVQIQKSINMQDNDELDEDLLEAVVGGADSFAYKQLMFGPLAPSIVQSNVKCRW